MSNYADDRWGKRCACGGVLANEQTDVLCAECRSKPPSIVCPHCSMRSYNPNDISERYCGNCHQWHTPIS